MSVAAVAPSSGEVAAAGGRHVVSALVVDRPGTLNRVAGLFRARAFNIESLTVGHTETPGLSRMTIVVDTDDRGARLVEANLYKLIPVRRVDMRRAAVSRPHGIRTLEARPQRRSHESSSASS